MLSQASSTSYAHGRIVRPKCFGKHEGLSDAFLAIVSGSITTWRGIFAVDISRSVLLP